MRTSLRPTAGVTVLDLLVAATVAGLLAFLTVPSLLGLSARLRGQMAAAEVVGALRQARAYAVRHNTRVAVRFDTADPRRIAFGLYRDGDGDGVRGPDIDTGVDPLIHGARSLVHLGSGIGFGIPPGLRPRDPGDPHRRLDRLDDPVRFNRSDLASFDPLGTATPGSLYLTDGGRHLWAVRVDNRAGRVRILAWSADHDRWESR